MRPLEVACDESGNDGENLFGGNATVFADASVDVTVEAARTLMADVRASTRSQAPELKSGVLLAAKNRGVLLSLLGDSRVANHVSIHLSEKRYFLVGKLVDLVIEELMYERGEDIYRDRRALRWARTLYNDAPEQLGGTWDGLLDAFNSLTRARAGVDKSADVERFSSYLNVARQSSSGVVANLLRLVDAASHQVEELARDSASADPRRILDLHPVFAALGQAARTWHEKTGRSIILIHDNAPGLTDRRGKLLIEGLRSMATAQLGVSPVPLREVRSVDSKLDARVQLADLFAGVGRSYAEKTLAGFDDPDVLSALRPHLNADSVWADQRSWEKLLGYPLAS
jgi:hypothetical protein